MPPEPPAVSAGADMIGIMPIAVDTITPETALDFDLFLRPKADAPVVLYRESRFPLSAKDLDKLRNNGIRTLFVRLDALDRYQQYLHDTLFENPDLPANRRLQILRAAHRAVFEDAMQRQDLARMVEFANDLGSQMSEVISSSDLVLAHVFSLMEHDYYTYTHVTNVSTYCLLLARALARYSGPDLAKIGSGALLHDLGKRDIPLAVLNKPGRFTEEERALMQQHPTLGFDMLSKREDIRWEQLMMVYQHHERIDGSGYPVGLCGDEIHEWAKICCVADVFDALTSNRPYRKADPVKDAIGYLRRNAGKGFDEEMVDCWIQTAGFGS